MQKTLEKPACILGITSLQTSRKGKVLSKGKEASTQGYFVNGISIFDKHSDWVVRRAGKRNKIRRGFALIRVVII
ncbi:MAG: hypothetical protein JNM22_02440 [Saprospiraceae bacterium]|nr:hypothetical protein [Saprospiraceae bacterium]